MLLHCSVNVAGLSAHKHKQKPEKNAHNTRPQIIMGEH